MSDQKGMEKNYVRIQLSTLTARPGPLPLAPLPNWNFYEMIDTEKKIVSVRWAVLGA